MSGSWGDVDNGWEDSGAQGGDEGKKKKKKRSRGKQRKRMVAKPQPTATKSKRPQRLGAKTASENGRRPTPSRPWVVPAIAFVVAIVVFILVVMAQK